MNILIKNASVLTMTDHAELINNASVFIEDGKIKGIGGNSENLKADKIIDGTNKLVMPGLINSHTHIAMSLFRNYADDLPFWPWLTERIMPLEEKLIPEHVYWGSMLSIVEMIKSGVTSFADMYFFMDEVAKAVDETGIRASLSIGMSDSGDQDLKINNAKKYYDSWHGKADGRITVMAGPHAPYSCEPSFLHKVINMAAEKGMGIHIHLSESKKEVEDSYNLRGKSPIKHVHDLGLFELPTLAAHCVHLSDEDIAILVDKKVNVANNPGSNLKLGNGFARVEDMLKKGVNVALGTDGSASNNNLNMFEEINLAALVNKALKGDTTSIPAATAVKMATLNGAKALGLEKEVGTLEVGKKADIVILDLNKPHFYPRYNLVASLAYSAQASDVETVIVDGKILMENYELKTIDVEKVMYNAEKCAKSLIK
ncbi:5-methylthioadenosine/S-adenosylhomocysteine deaminase [Proteiniborus ethanoligenes]|uniref:5-methylthioadenosine/S-adenosylhomocysteine deaminase n=1 Tax=Proteiniborus ethanoligenes TaxID=415015 RepID=A0A1H3RPN3_9FIRM|nr:amidohydrolase [Proteiniborus ethanoligenes]SDZ27724.1 5-methylthioadenosine/S-adenosylhomocysteine deaminase [Proteiniborus ethanoligenes]